MIIIKNIDGRKVYFMSSGSVIHVKRWSIVGIDQWFPIHLVHGAKWWLWKYSMIDSMEDALNFPIWKHTVYYRKVTYYVKKDPTPLSDQFILARYPQYYFGEWDGKCYLSEWDGNLEWSIYDDRAKTFASKKEALLFLDDYL